MHRFLSGTDDLSAVISERTIPFLDDGLIVSLNDCGKLFAFQPPRSFAAHRAPIQAGPLFSADALREPAKGERDPDRLIEAAQDAALLAGDLLPALKIAMPGDVACSAIFLLRSGEAKSDFTDNL